MGSRPSVPGERWIGLFVLGGLAAGMLLLALLFAGRAYADIAPPEQPPGSNISPGSSTLVRMSAETVVIDVAPGQITATAHVTGDFTMLNTGSRPEKMQVRFPLSNPSGEGNGFGGFPEVRDFSVRVGGKYVPTSVVTTLNPQAEHGIKEPIRWAAFDATFPAGHDLAVQVTYNITATGYPPSSRFAYVVETGAGWAGSIGSIDIVLRLPYPATDENVFSGEGMTTAGGKISNNEVKWHWDNWEPTKKGDNFFVTILAPKAWQAILDARAVVEAKPNDADAMLSLARAYNGAVTSRFPLDTKDHFALLSEETYEKAAALNPGSAAIHTEYAQVIWEHMTVQALPPPDDPNVQRVLTQVALALAIDPSNQQAGDLLKDVQSTVQGTVVLPTVTAPTAATEPPPTEAVPSSTPVVEPTTPPLPSATNAEAAPTAESTATPELSPTQAVAEATATPAPTSAPTPTAPAGSGSTGDGGAGNTVVIITLIAVPVLAALAVFGFVRARAGARP